MERAVVRSFLYLTFPKPPPNLSFSDQYAFRPTGSTTAATVSLLQTVTSLLQSNPYVVVISLDFSKAFDTVRHATLLNKMAELDLPVLHKRKTANINGKNRWFPQGCKSQCSHTLKTANIKSCYDLRSRPWYYKAYHRCILRLPILNLNAICMHWIKRLKLAQTAQASSNYGSRN
jgi:hypothetical protein